MGSDDLQRVDLLIKKMEESLPIPVRVTPETLKMIQGKDDKYQPDHVFFINKIIYGGDEIGITCIFQPNPERNIRVGASLTHLRVVDDHPLAEEIKDYQRKRSIRLALQDWKKGKVKHLAKKKSKKKGFGK